MADFTLYTASTPNGTKISIALEELGLKYETKTIDLGKNEQKEEWFLKINPNGRIPALVDHKNGDFNVFESGAILLYLVERYDPEGKLYPKDGNARSEVVQWLMFQMAGVGPMQGQAHHFYRYAPEKIEYGIKRYQDETKRLYSVLERQLSTSDYLAANQFTIADIATFTWVRFHFWAGVSLESFPHVQKWIDRIEARPAVQKGLNTPVPDRLQDLLKDPKYAEEAAKLVRNFGKENK
eukprot:TRINITY_DN879_c0_g1_i4.p1 TRINITY_DN879_c0_g1~~TRINITY_DN879_c0_g1_i4.p1  ORF type:complete len:238 (-),score=66.34 TRINITY_DN879_c0_g1_i4:125-838(-)